MDEISDVVTVPMDKSNFVQPFRMIFKQNGIERTWDLVKVHERYINVCKNSS